ncbi:hypothetical protein [Bacteroides nordii]|uniref:hypothetical protein n=1 Tax=Bacteroides nordii TaxID=291645 RepID=UPI00189CC027|nr:hypothetical protein [Bacteroides nordii]
MVETKTGSKEKRNIVIEFIKVDYYPKEGKQSNHFTGQFQKADSVFNEEILRDFCRRRNDRKGKDETKGEF